MNELIDRIFSPKVPNSVTKIQICYYVRSLTETKNLLTAINQRPSGSRHIKKNECEKKLTSRFKKTSK